MENKKIDFIVYEASMNRLDRINRRLIALVVLVLFMFTGLLSYTLWLLNDISVEEVTTTTTTQEVTQENESGDNNFIGNDGDITYGDTKDTTK